MPIPLDEFRECLAAAGLMTAEDVRAFSAALPADQQPIDGESLARELVRQRRLTPWQARQVLDGQAADLVLGNYVLLDKLGQGGMGQVFKAQHRRMKRVVALKLLPPALVDNDAALRRFEREVEAAARLSHPNIVTAFDADEAGGRHFLVMECVDGCDLGALVKRRGPLATDQAIDCVLQAARGLEHAHQQGVVHRDIKPGNLLVDARGTVKVLDMGLARVELPDAGESVVEEQTELTQSGMIMGTVDYMAPEQAANTRLADARADIYSLGCTLHFLLTGRPPFSGDSTLRKLVAHRTAPIPPLSAGRTDVPQALEEAYRRMLAKQPDERFQSMTDCIAALEACRGGASVTQARPATLWTPPADEPELANFLAGLADPALAGRTHRAATAEEVETAADTAGEQSLQRTRAFIAGEAAPPATKLGRSSLRGKARRTKALIGAGLAVLAICILWGLVVWTGGTGVKSADEGGETAQSFTVRPKPPVAVAGNAKKKRPTDDALAARDGLPPGIQPLDNQQAAAMQVAEAERYGWPLMFRNSVGARFALIPSGTFILGSPDEEVERLTEREVRRTFTVHRPFYMGTCEVTQEEYERVMGENPSQFRAGAGGGPTHPVESVIPNDMHLFPERLSALSEEEVAQRTYRLPNLDEWEYAARSFTRTARFFGDNDDRLVDYAWYGPNAGNSTHPVGLLKPSPWWLHDLFGNVEEWTQQWGKGGGYTFRAGELRAAMCDAWATTLGHPVAGMRLVCEVPVPDAAIAPFDAEHARQHQEAWAKHLDVPVEYTDQAGIVFRLIPPGEFLRGDTQVEVDAILRAKPPMDKRSRQLVASAAPARRVMVERPFYLAVHEVTQGQFQAAMAVNPSYNSAGGMGAAKVAGLHTDTFPVDSVAWTDAAEFCNRLSTRSGLTQCYDIAEREVTVDRGIGYRLPTETEWEFACRAGTATRFWTGDADASLRDAAWTSANSELRMHAVGALAPNPFGLHDMHGNVWEWCENLWGRGYDPPFADQPPKRAIAMHDAPLAFRGGDYSNPPASARAALRSATATSGTNNNGGFRVALSVAAVRYALKLPSPHAADASADRAVAAWVQSVGGDIGIAYDGVPFMNLTPGRPLPADSFFLITAGLHRCQVTDDDLRRFTGLPRFTTIVLSGTAVTDAGLENLGELPALQKVYLGSLPVSERGLQALRRWPGITHMHLTSIDDGGAETIAGFTDLIDLWLTAGPLTDVGLLQLAALKRLRTLNVNGTQVTRAGVDALREALPDCTVDTAFGRIGPPGM